MQIEAYNSFIRQMYFFPRLSCFLFQPHSLAPRLICALEVKAVMPEKMLSYHKKYQQMYHILKYNLVTVKLVDV